MTTTATKDGEKSIVLDQQNNNFARASRLFVQALPSLHDYNGKLPKFTFGRGREQKKTTFLFFSLTLRQSFRIQQHSKNICEHLTNLTRWNKRDKVWGSANSLFKWRFRSRRLRRCVNSLFFPATHDHWFCSVLNFLFLIKILIRPSSLNLPRLLS